MGDDQGHHGSTQFKAFDVPYDRLNLNGAPLPWASVRGLGNTYLLTRAISMRERNARYGVLSLCAGSRQGMAVLLENSQWT